MSTETLHKCPQCDYSAPPELIHKERKHFDSYRLECTRCGFSTATHPATEAARNAWNGEASAGSWIAVSERLPEIGDRYNVVCDLNDGDDPISDTLEWIVVDKKWYYPDGTGTEFETEGCKVLYWQPLPKPPKHKPVITTHGNNVQENR